jgi:DNA modification methylase
MANQLLHGDCLEVMRGLPDNSVDAIVTDPPAGISFMGKDWDKDKGGRAAWVAWMESVARECLRVLKPGGHALVWAIPRTSHWTGMAWEDAGWEPRDKIYHCFGSGFPKSADISKAIDKMAGAQREVVDEKFRGFHAGKSSGICGKTVPRIDKITAPATPEAQQWDGWGTALKPAVEEWWLFRKPISEANIAANVLRWGVGGLHIDGCRVEGCESTQRPNGRTAIWHDGGMKAGIGGSTQGRFPAHLIHDGSEEVVECFPESESRPAKYALNGKGVGHNENKGSVLTGFGGSAAVGYNDSGSAARFFKACPDDDLEDAETRRLVYQAKASKADRDEGLEEFEAIHRPNGNKWTDQDYRVTKGERPPSAEYGPRRNHHPTVKSTNLMRYLCRLITPPGGIVLDPFMGSGSTGKGAALEGFQFIGIEQDAEYLEIARARIAAAVARSEALSLEQRVAWLETQVQAQGAKLRKIEAQHQQMSLFG